MGPYQNPDLKQQTIDLIAGIGGGGGGSATEATQLNVLASLNDGDHSAASILADIAGLFQTEDGNYMADSTFNTSQSCNQIKGLLKNNDTGDSWLADLYEVMTEINEGITQLTTNQGSALAVVTVVSDDPAGLDIAVNAKLTGDLAGNVVRTPIPTYSNGGSYFATITYLT